MTKITITHDIVSIQGHSGYAEIGSDIVCAAISAIGQVLAYGACEYKGGRVRRGDALLEIECGDGALKRACIHGFKKIAKQYPDNVKVIDRR